jgi:hypothetical protein
MKTPSSILRRLTHVILLIAAALTVLTSTAHAGVFYGEPPGGWTYIYTGDAAAPGSGTGFDALDGLWSQDNGSDAWDGSIIGGTLDLTNKPGGVMSIDGYLRMQDCGDPRDYPEFGGQVDPSNRKYYFGKDISANGASTNVLDEGVTLGFRMRVPTSGPLDPLYPDGGTVSQPYPAQGDGYYLHDGGKSGVGLKQANGGIISFSLMNAFDTTLAGPGLTMNHLVAGAAASGAVDFTDANATRTNVLALADPTEWHEFWVTIIGDTNSGGTHRVEVYVDGATTAEIFHVTSGSGSDYTGISYLAMGVGATPQNGALDVDYFSFKSGVYPPVPARDTNSPPAVIALTPTNTAVFYPANGGVNFTVNTLPPNTIDPSAVRLFLNGTEVTLTIGGDSTNRTATFGGLQPNTFYISRITASDTAGRSMTNDFSFNTFVSAQAVVMEAENFNFDDMGDPCDVPPFRFGDGVGGSFINNPVPGQPPASGGYLNSLPLLNIDYSVSAPSNSTVYRCSADDMFVVGTRVSRDLPRAEYIAAGVGEIDVAQLQTNDWLNYSHTYAASNYQVYLRVASSAAQQFRLDCVSSDPGMSDQTTSPLGTFATPNTGSSVYRDVPLTDSAGRNAVLRLSGVRTVRLTSMDGTSSAWLNYLVLVPSATPPNIAFGNLNYNGNIFTMSFQTQCNASYVIEYKNALTDANWTLLRTEPGTGQLVTVADTGATTPTRFYRVRVE